METTQNESRFNQHVLMYTSLALSTILMFVHHYTGSTLIALAGLLVILVPILFLNLNECIYLLLFYVPNCRMYKFVSGNTFLGLFIMALFFKIIILERRTISRGVILAILSMMAVLFANIATSGNTSSLVSGIRFIMGTVVVTCYGKAMKHDLDDKKEYDACIKHFIYGCASMLTCGILFYLMQGKPLFDERFYAVHSDPNYVGMTLAVAISFLLTHIIYDKNAGAKEFIMVMYLLFGGMLTVSRAFVIAVSINLILILYIFTKGKNLSGMQKLGILILIGIVCYIFRDAISGMIESFQERFNDETMEGGNGRTEIATTYIDLWKRDVASIFWGIGSASTLYQMGVTDAVHHNYYVQILTTIGVMGCLAMLLVYGVLFKSISLKPFKPRFLLAFPFLTYAIMLLTLPALFDDTHLCFLTLIFLQHRRFQNEKRRHLA